MDEETATVWQDVLWLMIGGLAFIVVMTLELLNPKAEESQAANCRGAAVMVEIRWPDGDSSDVDLWFLAPGDGPVGYSRLRGQVANLLRDDLGTVSDILALNYEIACSRGIPAGEWVVNVHLYRQAEAAVPVAVKISGKTSDEGTSTRFSIEKTVTLERAGQEITVVRFDTDSRGQLISGSQHDAPRPLRSASQ